MKIKAYINEIMAIINYILGIISGIAIDIILKGG